MLRVSLFELIWYHLFVVLGCISTKIMWSVPFGCISMPQELKYNFIMQIKKKIFLDKFQKPGLTNSLCSFEWVQYRNYIKWPWVRKANIAGIILGSTSRIVLVVSVVCIYRPHGLNLRCELYISSFWETTIARNSKELDSESVDFGHIRKLDKFTFNALVGLCKITSQQNNYWVCYWPAT